MAISRLPFAVVNGFMGASMLTVAVLLMVPTEFLRSKNVDNEAAGVRIDWSRLMCKTPAPNLNMTDEDVCRFWKLPKTVRLSPRMVEAGRCGVAVAERNAKRSSKMDETICYCVNIWWVPVMASVASGLSLAAFIRFVCMLIEKNRPLTASEILVQERSQTIQSLLFVGTMIAYLTNLGNDFSYTEYGDLYPTPYLDVQPATWRAAFWLFLGGNFVQTCCFHALAKRCACSCGCTCGCTCTCSWTRTYKRAEKKKRMRTPITTRSDVKIALQIEYRPEYFERDSPAGLFQSADAIPSAKETQSPPISPPPSTLFTVCECASVAEKSETASVSMPTVITVLDRNETDASSAVEDQIEEKKAKPEVAGIDAVKGTEEKEKKKGADEGGGKEKEEAKDGKDELVKRNGDVKTDD